RPPDLRHLDAAFSTLGTSPHGETSLRLAITDLFATRCVSCGRTLPADELEWQATQAGKAHYPCQPSLRQQNQPEPHAADTSPADSGGQSGDVGAAGARRRPRDRLPPPDGGDPLVDAILNLHTDRQLVGLAAILARVEGELRAAPIESALRLAFLHA